MKVLRTTCLCELDQTLFQAGAYNFQSMSAMEKKRSGHVRLGEIKGEIAHNEEVLTVAIK